ncbi:MAG TPA: ABC transporter permease [Candidatus Acidoferrum sp.]|jgi:ABC-2 type transport system permease protein
MMRIFRDFRLFFLRDLRIARTYRSPFVLEAIEALFTATMFFYGARFVDSPELRASLPQGHSYFAYALVGFVFFDYLTAALNTFERTLQEARDTGTLEPLLVTQVSLPVVLAGSSLYPFCETTLRIMVYLGWGAILFGFPLASANWISVIAVIITTLFAFSALGIFSASFLLLFKRGNPGKWLIVGISSIVGGMLFPVTILPDWLQVLAHLNPVTYAMDAMRAALLDGANLATIGRPLLILAILALILLPLSMTAFGWALRRTKMNGTLTHS